MAHTVYHNFSFGEKLDTSKAKRTAITLINPKGKVKWSISTNVVSFDEMTSGDKGGVFAVGRSSKYGGHESTLGNKKLDKSDRNYVVQISSKGKVKKIWSQEVSTSNEPTCMARTQNGEIVVSCEVWCGLSIDLPRIEEGLPSLECYGGVPILVKIKQ